MTLTWICQAIWVGFVDDSKTQLDVTGLAIRRGAASFVDGNIRYRVNVNGYRTSTWQSSAATLQDVHFVNLSQVGRMLPVDATWALGWLEDESGYAFNWRGAPAVVAESALKGLDRGLQIVPHRKWPQKWTTRLLADPTYSPYKGHIHRSLRFVHRPCRKQ